MFFHRFALAFGIWDTDTLANQITARQLRTWLAYFRLEPFGDEWRRTARLASIVAAAAGAKVPEDFQEMFLPTFDPRRPRQTEDEMLAELNKLTVGRTT